jgi:hypothetical protein
MSFQTLEQAAWSKLHQDLFPVLITSPGSSPPVQSMSHSKDMDGPAASSASSVSSGLSGADTLFHRESDESSTGSMTTYALSKIPENAAASETAKAVKRMQLEELMRLRSEGSFEMQVNGAVHSRGFQKEQISTTWQSFQNRDKDDLDAMQRAPSTPAVQQVGKGSWMLRKIRKAFQPRHRSLDTMDHNTSSLESRMYVGGGSVDMF